MATKKMRLITAVLLVMCHIFETEGLTAKNPFDSLQKDIPMTHFREKRDAPDNYFLYMIDIEVYIKTDNVTQQIWSFLNPVDFPILLNDTLSIDGVDLSTLCYPNGAGYQCKCEDQFAWPYSSCVNYGSCDNIYDNACGCINSIPTDGQFCQYKPHTTVITTAETSPTTPNTTDTTPNYELKINFKMNQEFTDDLKNPKSETYKKYKNDLETAINKNYKDVPGFVKATVTGFSNREGSVIVDLTVETTTIDVNGTQIANANSKLVTDLSDYNTSSDSFTVFIDDNSTFFKNLDPLYTNDNMELSCNAPPDIQILPATWTLNGIALPNDNDKYIITLSPQKLTVKNVASNTDSGLYGCKVKNSLVTYHQTENIQILPLPQITITLFDIRQKCRSVESVPLECCVTPKDIADGNVEWLNNDNKPLPSIGNVKDDRKCFVHNYAQTETNCTNTKFTCQVINIRQNLNKTATLTYFEGEPDCNKPYGAGKNGVTIVVGCSKNQTGTQTYQCQNGVWNITEDRCLLPQIRIIQSELENLVPATVPVFVEILKNATADLGNDIVKSEANINAVVNILNTLSNVKSIINEAVMTNILQTVDILVSNTSTGSWEQLNKNEKTQNSSSILLLSMETLVNSISSETFSISTDNIQLEKSTIGKYFNKTLRGSKIHIHDEGVPPSTGITTIVFTTMNTVLPARAGNNSNVAVDSINGFVLLAQVNATIRNVSLSFDKINNSLANPQCVFWNFSINNNIGGWDSSGCELQAQENNRVTCICNHLTSFSILMSPLPALPPGVKELLDFITYIGVGISMGSLVLCLIIEASVWRTVTKNSIAHIRHVSIVNIALSLLIADIWFIIGAAIVDRNETTPLGPCSAATFFIHFFYLALFFWMFISALLLVYRLIMVFSHMSKSTMMAIAFTVGYGGPLIIAIITIAVTAPQGGYFHKDEACWLNWYETKALLAFVIPALVIIFINLIILIVVLVKMLVRGIGENRQSEENNALLVIVRCVPFLTPLFGLTWGFGIGTMLSPGAVGFHIVFAVLNAIQGLFIFLFGTLLDSRVRAAISGRFAFIHTLSNKTRSTNGEAPSSSAAVPHLYETIVL